MKSRGANVFCSVCHAEPYPDDPSTTRETFDLIHVDDAWFCEQHRPAKQMRPSRIAAATPLAALAEFERVCEAESARFEEVLVEDDNDLLPEFKAYSSEVARALAEVRKALTPQKPPPPPDDAPRSRPPKKIKANERLGTMDWLAGDAQPAGEDVS